jgi:MFS family permease
LRSRIFTAFESRDFRLMWAGACTSSIGTWMQKLAQSWLVFQLSGSAFMLGLDNFLGEIPIFLFALYAGVVADRVDRRRLLVASQLLQMGCAFTLAVLFALGRAEVWHILSLSFLVGTAQAFGAPAYQSLLPSLVPREHISQRDRDEFDSVQRGAAGGSGGGRVDAEHAGGGVVFRAERAQLRGGDCDIAADQRRHVPSTKKETVMESMKEGLRFIRAQKGMVELILVSFFCTFLGIPIVVFLPVFAKDVFGGAEGTYTLLLTVEAAGAIAGALLVAARGKRGHLGRDAMMSLAGLGVFMTAFALTPRIELALVFLFFGGLTLIACFALLSSLVQMIATDEMSGRVMSIYNIAFRGGMPIGSLVVGQFVAQYSAPPVVAVNGVRCC